MPLEIEIENVAPRICIYVKGEVDLYTSPELRKAMLKAVEQAGEGVALNLQAVAYMDSSGVATLVEGLKANADQQRSFVLQQPSPAVMKVLQLSRLDSVFQIET